MKMQVTRLVSFMKGQYNALRYGDVFEGWDQLMRLVRLTDPTTKRKNVLVNTIIELWMAFTLSLLTRVHPLAFERRDHLHADAEVDGQHSTTAWTSCLSPDRSSS